MIAAGSKSEDKECCLICLVWLFLFCVVAEGFVTCHLLPTRYLRAPKL